MHVPYAPQCFPMIEVMIIYFWSLYFRRSMPASFAFLLGLFQDVLFGTPLGVTALSNMLLRSVVLAKRKDLFGQSFVVIWTFFAICAIAILCVKWLLFSLIYQQVFGSGASFFMQGALTVLLYPMMHQVFYLLKQRLGRAENA